MPAVQGTAAAAKQVAVCCRSPLRVLVLGRHCCGQVPGLIVDDQQRISACQLGVVGLVQEVAGALQGRVICSAGKGHRTRDRHECRSFT